MQSSTGQYSTHAGDPAQPVQHSVMTASSFGFFLRGVVSPLERGSCFSSRGTTAADLTASDSVAMAGIILSIPSLATPSAQPAATGVQPRPARSLYRARTHATPNASRFGFFMGRDGKPRSQKR